MRKTPHLYLLVYVFQIEGGGVDESNRYSKSLFLDNVVFAVKNPPETETMLSNIGQIIGFDYDLECALHGDDKANAGLLLRLSELIEPKVVE